MYQIMNLVFRYCTTNALLRKDGSSIKIDRFDDTNSEKLTRMSSEKYTDAGSFNFDPRCINWEDYFLRAHIPGLGKHIMGKPSHSRL
ncbi:hypothetical protein ACLB2K_045808 [Fragaria x ananassa]